MGIVIRDSKIRKKHSDGTFSDVFEVDSSGNVMLAQGKKFLSMVDANTTRDIIATDGTIQVTGGTTDYTQLTNRPTALSQFTNDLGNYGNWITTSALSGYATQDWVTTNVINGAPGALDTLNELAAALGDDANFATTVTNSIATKLPLGGGVMSGNIGRSSAIVGFLEGSYNNVGGNSTNTNPIYTIGSNYNPASTTLSNMYGVGYSNVAASFITLTGASDWGFYVAADGDARVWLDGSTGNISGAGNVYASGGNSTEWNTAYGWGNHAGLYAAASHTHDDRYYTESEVDNLLSGKLSSDSDSEQAVGGNTFRFNLGENRANIDPRWNESGYDADLGVFHMYATTSAGVSWGRTGIALYNGSAYQYLTTRGSTTGIFLNNQEIIHSGNIGSQSVNYATSAGAVAWGNVSDIPSTFAPSSHTHSASEVGLGNVSNAAQVTTSYNSSLNSDSRNSRGVTRLYRREDDSDYSVQAHWTGTHWWLRGYNGDTHHAEARVSYADAAGSAPANGGNADTVGGFAKEAFPYRSSGTSGYYQVADWVQFNTTAGIYWPSYNSAHIYANTTGTYGSIRIDGVRNGWEGIYFNSGATLMMNATNVGIFRQDVGWYFEWTNGSLIVYKGTGGGGTAATVIDSVNYTSHVKSTVTIQDTVPGGTAGQLWWESDTGKLKVYYDSAWVDASPNPDMSIYYTKAGGAITGEVTIQQTLTVVGNVLIEGTLTETSDITLKENITPLQDSLNKISKLNGVTFNKKTTPELKEIGFIAQEVEEVLPELVTETEEGIKTVAYSRVTAVLVETIKEQQAQIDELKELVSKLAEKLNSL